MRFMKPIMGIAVIGAMMLTMRVVMQSKKSSGMRKRRNMMRRGR